VESTLPAPGSSWRVRDQVRATILAVYEVVSMMGVCIYVHALCIVYCVLERMWRSVVALSCCTWMYIACINYYHATIVFMDIK
jgi:hypothetical protein